MTPIPLDQKIGAAISQIEWYVACLNDIRLGKSVRNFDEAASGYKSALSDFRELQSMMTALREFSSL